MQPDRGSVDARRYGSGRILGRPGVYHYPAAHDLTPSRNYGFGFALDSLCGKASGVVYDDDTLANLFPDDRLCKFCEKEVLMAFPPDPVEIRGVGPKPKPDDALRHFSEGRA